MNYYKHLIDKMQLFEKRNNAKKPMKYSITFQQTDHSNKNPDLRMPFRQD